MKTIKYFSMAVLAIVGAVMTSCSSDNNNEVVTPPQPVNTDKVETLTVSVSMGNSGAGTRALDADGHKTFAVGDQIAVVYKNTSGNTVKAESAALTSKDIASGSKSADFTVTLTNPDKEQNVTYIYPAVMAKSDGTPDYDALATQNGTLATLASKLDYCEYTGAWSGPDLPTGEMNNQLVVCAYTLKNSSSEDITNTVTTMTVSDGTNVYIVNRTAAAGPIYVAIKPTDNKNIKYTAIANSKVYTKNVTGKTYTNGEWYPLGLIMTQNDNIMPGLFSVSGEKVYFSRSNLQAKTTNNGSTWSWHFSENNTQYARVGTGANIYINGNGTVSDSGNGLNIDLFGWSTSTTHLGINNSTNNETYRKSGITDGSDFVDWGSAKEVTDCIGTGWRTLNKNEWRYLMETRGGNCFAMATLGDSRGGMILLPDDWKTTYYALSSINNGNANLNSNGISYSDWTSKLEAHGAVFLPVTGQRSGTTVTGYDEQLHYWSSTGGLNSSSVPIGYHLRWMPFGDNKGLAPDTGAGRCNGYAVRLVYDIK